MQRMSTITGADESGSQGPALTALSPRDLERLLAAVQDLSLAHDLEGVTHVVRRAARELAGSDGATFVLRDGDQCSYVDEDAISPLWKGRRFPIESCISGWSMLHREPVVIEDVFADARILRDAYEPTFVKSLVMVPIRAAAPIGAIGNYWADRRRPEPETVRVLQALANSTSVALANVQLYTELESRVRERTRELETAYRELETFSYSVSHDLRAPLRSISSFTQILEEEFGASASDEARSTLSRVTSAAGRMSVLIDALLQLAQISRRELVRERVNLARFARELSTELQLAEPARSVEWRIQPQMQVDGDAGLLRTLVENLLRNAWKFSSRVAHATIEFDARDVDGERVFTVRDDGVGFDSGSAAQLFAPFQRQHATSDFPGSGIGLATVERVVQRHGGRVWAESQVGKGAAFHFTLAPRHTSAG